MTPGEIHGLHKQVVDDLKEQLAAAREDARNERTRAEAAEQELREVKESTRVGLAACTAAAFKDADKLAAIRSHLKGVGVAEMLAGERDRPTLSRIAKEGSVHARDHLARMDLAKINKRLFDCAPTLLAAAREALEP